MPIGTFINKLMKERGWTEPELAKISGVKRSTISLLILTRGRMPDYKIMRLLAQAFGMSTDEFYENALQNMEEIDNTKQPIPRKALIPAITPESQLEMMISNIRKFHPPTIPIYNNYLAMSNRAASSYLYYQPMNNEMDPSTLFGMVSDMACPPFVHPGDYVIFERGREPEPEDVCCIYADNRIICGMFEINVHGNKLVKSHGKEYSVLPGQDVLVAVRVIKILSHHRKSPVPHGGGVISDK